MCPLHLEGTDVCSYCNTLTDVQCICNYMYGNLLFHVVILVTSSCQVFVKDRQIYL